MTKSKIFGLIVFLLISLGVAGVISLYLQNKNSRQNIEKPGLPDAIGANFKPTLNSAMYKIVSVDLVAKTMKLKILWPINLGNEINSQIECASDDIKIVTQSDPNPKSISLDAMLDKASVTDKEMQTFSGICREAECMVIDKACELYVGNE